MNLAESRTHWRISSLRSTIKYILKPLIFGLHYYICHYCENRFTHSHL
jgi:hypothetical protein